MEACSLEAIHDDVVKKVKIKMESDNNDEKVKNEYNTYKNEVIK